MPNTPKIIVNPAIFRAYDIRGTALATENKPTPDLTEETVLLIGRGVGTYLTEKYQTKNMIVGRDNRTHSEKLQKAFIKGVLSTGINVQNAGLTSSPMIYFASCFYGSDSAVNITASHNPKEDNGIKIVGKHAHSIADQELQEIRKIIEYGDFKESTKPGDISQLKDLFENYLQKIKENTKLGRPMKVVLDAGNGVTGPYAPQILRACGAEVIELYCEPDGEFPNHEANPEHEKNMIELKNMVIRERADLGIGFDGDGDRIGLIDEKGNFRSAEFSVMLLARELLKAHPGEKIIHDVKVNQALPDDIKAHGGAAIMSRVGHSFIERRLKEEGATLAGEKSGHMFFSERFYNWYGFDDAIFAAAKIIEALSKSEQSFSEIFSDIPTYPGIPELKIACPDDKKEEIITEVTKHFLEICDPNSTDPHKPINCVTLDGVRALFPDGAWILIRYSNTSPYLTLHAEAPNERRLNEVKVLTFDHLQKYPELHF